MAKGRRTAKQIAASKRNLELARRKRKSGTKSKSKKMKVPKGMWTNKKTGDRLYGNQQYSAKAYKDLFG